MWNKIEESSSEDETLGNSFFTNGLFKISNEEKVSFLFIFSGAESLLDFLFSSNYRAPEIPESMQLCKTRKSPSLSIKA